MEEAADILVHPVPSSPPIISDRMGCESQLSGYAHTGAIKQLNCFNDEPSAAATTPVVELWAVSQQDSAVPIVKAPV